MRFLREIVNKRRRRPIEDKKTAWLVRAYSEHAVG